MLLVLREVTWMVMDIDLFIGARSMPAKYGVLPLSFVLENNGRGGLPMFP